MVSKCKGDGFKSFNFRDGNDLMEANPGTPEGDELERLVTLVEKCEKLKYPIDPPDPKI